MSAIVEHSDCRAYLATLATNSIDACTTDTPYELNFMGREWDRSGIANQVELWREVYRVLKPGAHLVVFGGTRTYHRMVCAIEDAGFEIRDTLQWLYGSGFNKNRNCLKPAHEPICLARKPVAKTVAATVAAYGTGGINVDACRVGTDDMSAQWDREWKQDGTFGNGKRASQGKTSIGRWPPNVLLSHSASCNGHCAPDCPVAALDRQSGVIKSGARKGPNPNAVTAMADAYDGGWKYSGGPCEASEGGASRFYPILNYDPVYDDPFLYCAKASKKERGAGNNHPTVKPVTLCRWLVRLVTPLGGTALDPFAGSGSFGVACVLEGRHYKGCDQDAEYVEIANRRVAATQPALIGV